LDERHHQELAEHNQKLEVKLNKSLMKIDQLEGQIEEYQRLNQSACLEGN
jgi:predicted RNase H-like nuclease (RuvC/YqgF family)